MQRAHTNNSLFSRNDRRTPASFVPNTKVTTTTTFTKHDDQGQFLHQELYHRREANRDREWITAPLYGLLNEADVLLGEPCSITKHAKQGTDFYWEQIRNFAEPFRTTSNELQQDLMIQRIIESVWEQDGRFLVFDKNIGSLLHSSNDNARKQAERDLKRASKIVLTGVFTNNEDQRQSLHQDLYRRRRANEDKQWITTPLEGLLNDADVLLGAPCRITKHAKGTAFYWKQIRDFAEPFRTTSNELQQDLMMKRIIESVWEQDGRFLVFDKNSGSLLHSSNDNARKQVERDLKRVVKTVTPPLGVIDAVEMKTKIQYTAKAKHSGIKNKAKILQATKQTQVTSKKTIVKKNPTIKKAATSKTEVSKKRGRGTKSSKRSTKGSRKWSAARQNKLSKSTIPQFGNIVFSE